ncbi:chaplin [Streptomyces sp. NPDC008001]|uniref:chaplin n=1 Tax=Streptomyces sp. NPDC008001 TaxID=3364804 RepID=UPI0036EF0FE2
MTPSTKAAATAAAALLATAGAAATATADSVAAGGADKSAGVITGNTIQVPLRVPVTLCSFPINIIGLLNSTAGNVCVSD